MAYMQVLSACYGCGRLFSYNPDLVPSIRVNDSGAPDEKGCAEPICQSCVDLVNPIRIANGLEPIRPLPGAYEPQEVA